MRRFNPLLGWQGAGIIFALMMLLSAYAQAFPLDGGNGIVNATVYGVMKYEYGDGLYVDVSASDADAYNVELIDSNDKTYSDNNAPYRSKLHGFPTETEYNGAIRDMLLFNVPKDAIVKSLRIVPSSSDPFYINWTGMPEAKSNNETLIFYGAIFEPNGMRWRQGNWNLDVSIANAANQTVECNNSNFAIVDQFGWSYPGEKGDTLKEIPAGESLRFNVKVPFVSEISRPVAILFRDIKLNIAGWA